MSQISEEDKVKALTLFKLCESDEDEDKDDIVEEISTDGVHAFQRNHRRIIDVPVSSAPGGSVRITSNSVDSEVLRELRDFASRP